MMEKRLSKEEQIDLVKRIRKGEKEAQNIFVEANLGLVHTIAKKFYYVGKKNILEYNDLVQEGCLALIYAVNKFDPEKGIFSSYACRCIENQIHALVNETRFKIPSDDKKDYYKISGFIDQYIVEKGETPLDQEISDATELELDRVKELQKIYFMENVFSLESKLSYDEDDTFKDIVGVCDNYSDLLYQDALREIAKRVGKTTNTLMREVMEYYIFLEKDDEQAQRGGEKNQLNERKIIENRMEEVAEKFGITKERARQIVSLYEEYQKKIQNIKYIDDITAKDLMELVPEIKNGIGTFHTETYYDEMNTWSNLKNDDFSKGWDDLYKCENTWDVISRVEDVHFYEGMVHYLYERFGMLIPEIKIETILEEIKTNAKKKSSLKALLTRVIEQSEEPLSDWKVNKLEKEILNPSINENTFLKIAFGLNMNLEEVEEFLKKFLNRDGLNPFDEKEIIYYIAFKYVKSEQYDFVNKALEYYQGLNAKKLFVQEEGFNTQKYKGQIEEEIEKIIYSDGDIRAAGIHKFENVFAHVKYMKQSQDYQRTANKVFLKMEQEFKSLIKKDVQESLSSVEDKELALGKVYLEYDCFQGIQIPKNHIFKSSKDDTLYAKVLEEVVCEKTDTFTVQVLLDCVKGNEIIAHNTQFVRDKSLSYIVSATNRRKFAAQKDKKNKPYTLYVECKLNKKQIGNLVLPKGTIFKAGSCQYAVIEDVRIVPTITVPVYADREIKNVIDTIENEKDYPQILHVRSEKISKSNSKREDSKNKELRISNKLDGKIERYLYLASGGNTLYDAGIKHQKDEMCEKLICILKGKDIHFSNTNAKVNGEDKLQAGVDREKLFTMILLNDMAKQQFSHGQEKSRNSKMRLIGRIQEINKYLNESGFYGVYLANPYDRLMLYISTFEDEPLNVYRNLWGIAQDYQKEKAGGSKE